MALVFDDPRTASVKAIADSNLIIITRDAMQRKLMRTDPTIKAIVRMLTKRMVTANNAVIQKKTDTADLIETTRMIYENVLSGLPRSQQRTFQNSVLPKLDDFMDSLRAFNDRFEKDAPKADEKEE